MKFIVLSLVMGHASAAGCFPAYSGGGSYSVGSSVSSAISTTTPVVWSSCTVSPTCLTGYVQTGGVTTITTYNFVCKSKDWCNNVGYAPGGTYSDIAWTKEAASCSVCSTADPDMHRSSLLASSSSSSSCVERRCLASASSNENPPTVSNPPLLASPPIATTSL